MGFFDSPGETERRQKLKTLEDARLVFAEQMQKQDFRPETMLLTSTERGGLIGLSRDEGGLWLVIGPDFGTDDGFTLERCLPDNIRREEHYVPAEGMGGYLGFGKKGEKGFYLMIDRGGVELSVPFIINKNSAAAFPYKRNPLLSTKRRRGDANVVWDLQPLDKTQMSRVEKTLSEIVKI